MAPRGENPRTVRDDRGVTNCLALVRRTLAGLTDAGFNAAVFGGWAEELHGLAEPRAHSDIDLIVVDPSLRLLDEYIRDRGEVADKRHSHKRAFVSDGVLVELFILRTGHDGLLTTFWDTYEYAWPPVDPVEINGLRVASREALAAYRRDHAGIMARRAVVR